MFNFSKGGIRKRYGGSVLSNGMRKGDLATGIQGKKTAIGYISGESKSSISISDANGKRIGQFSNKKVRLIRRSNGLCIS